MEKSTQSRRFKSIAEQFADLDDPTPKDFDPEDPDAGQRGSDDESHSEVDEDAGREHYQDVGKSKLRKPETVTLGKEYSGSLVSRNELEGASDDDDPFRRHESDVSEDDSLDEDSDESIDDGDEDISQDETDSDGHSEEMSELDGGSGAEQDSENEDESDDGDFSDDLSASEEEETAAPLPTNGATSDDREELRRLMATDQKSVAATISQAAKADATKGFGVKKQRSTFDALLNARIKLQKGLTALNELPHQLDEETNGVDENAIKSAESAALALWSTLETLRLALADVHSKNDSKKRKRPSAVSVTSPESLWHRMQDLEAESQVHRRAILEKWNNKVRGPNASLPHSRGKLLGSSDKQSITAVLDAHIASETGDRAAKAKKQRSNGSSDTREQLIYDDAAFYQSLLRDLVEQRMSSSDAVTNGLDSLHLQLPTHPTSGMRKDKVRKNVDTKASKGRKMRYNVHEKLQNFMAPEDRSTWTTRARDEFFASLLGKSASGVLGESEDEDDANGTLGNASDEEDLEEGGLRLFRSS